jgi:hypothetical protein
VCPACERTFELSSFSLLLLPFKDVGQLQMTFLCSKSRRISRMAFRKSSGSQLRSKVSRVKPYVCAAREEPSTLLSSLYPPETQKKAEYVHVSLAENLGFRQRMRAPKFEKVFSWIRTADTSTTWPSCLTMHLTDDLSSLCSSRFQID